MDGWTSISIDAWCALDADAWCNLPIDFVPDEIPIIVPAATEKAFRILTSSTSTGEVLQLVE